MSDVESNDDDDFDQENDVEIREENAESDLAEEEGEQKETIIEEQPQIVIERVCHSLYSTYIVIERR